MQYIVDEKILKHLLGIVGQDPEKALETIKQANKSEATLDIKYKIELIQGLALAHASKNEKAERLLARACRFLIRANSDFGIAEGLDALASLYLIKGDTNKAMMTWLDCLQHSIQYHNSLAQMRAHLGMGKTYFGLDNFTKAKQHHLTAIEISFQIENCPLSCEAFICLAIDYIKLIEFDKSYSCIRIANDYIDQAVAPQRSKCEIDIYFGMSFMGQGELNLALEHLSDAISGAEKTNYPWALALAYIEHAKCLNLLGRDELACESAFKAQTLSLELNSLFFSCQCSALLMQIYKDKGDYKSALQHHLVLTQLTLAKMDKSRNQELSPTLLKYMQRAEERIELENSQKENVALQSRLATHQILIKQLTDKAERDPLTGIFNRRALDIRLEREIELANQLNQDFSVLMLDIDHFKKINDSYSHQVGDEVIRTVVQLISQSCREGEFIARYGGEEFTVLLPSANGTAAINVAERIRETIAEFKWDTIHPQLETASISIGVACYIYRETSTSLVSRADTALYSAKHQGRNRVVYTGN